MKVLQQLNSFYLKQRFFPNFVSLLINPFYLNRVLLLKAIKKYSKDLNGDLLDFGCGAKPYESLFVNVNKYIGVDIENDSHNHSNENIDIYYDGKTLPFEKDFFDSIFTSEVFEHVPNINETLLELNRVLKNGGKLLITTPFSFPEHEIPFDFRRFTKNGIIKLIEENGYKVDEVKTYGNFITVLFQLIILYIHDLIYTKNKYINLLLNFIFIFPFTLSGVILSFILPRNRSLYFGIILLATKNK